jgi:uncharacterized protein (TIGR00297 family)
MIETILIPKELMAASGRAGAGLVVAACVGTAAWRAGWLSRSGFVAAVGCGTAAVAAGWTWGLLLVVYFVAASALSRAGRSFKADRMGGIVAKGAARDAAQVLANGGVFALAALCTLINSSQWIAWGAIGALAASSSDTWSTEVGVGLGGEPRSILRWRHVRAGESGGVTAAGFVGAAAGAAWIGLAADLIGFPRWIGIAALVAGFGGAVADSILGAVIQERLWCDQCAEPTECTVHRCGSAARRVGGIARLNNDTVNLLSTVVGLLLGVMIYRIVGAGIA